MLAAGWGDMGSVQCDMALEVPMLSQKAMCVDSSETGLRDIGEEYLSIAEFLRRKTQDHGRLVTALNARYPEVITAQLDIEVVADLVGLGLDQDIANELSALIGDR